MGLWWLMKPLCGQRMWFRGPRRCIALIPCACRQLAFSNREEKPSVSLRVVPAGSFGLLFSVFLCLCDAISSRVAPRGLACVSCGPLPALSDPYGARHGRKTLPHWPLFDGIPPHLPLRRLPLACVRPVCVKVGLRKPVGRSRAHSVEEVVGFFAFLSMEGRRDVSVGRWKRERGPWPVARACCQQQVVVGRRPHGAGSSSRMPCQSACLPCFSLAHNPICFLRITTGPLGPLAWAPLFFMVRTVDVVASPMEQQTPADPIVHVPNRSASRLRTSSVYCAGLRACFMAPQAGGIRWRLVGRSKAQQTNTTLLISLLKPLSLSLLRLTSPVRPLCDSRRGSCLLALLGLFLGPRNAGGTH